MHSYGYRANGVLSLSLTILALLCTVASLSGGILNLPPPSAQVEVSLTLNISANLESLFTWNTKQIFVFLAAEYETPKNSLNQVSIWDGIIPSIEQAKFRINTINKYRLADQGNNLRGREFNLTLHWHVMPRTGKMFADKIVMTGYRMPHEYV
eukprot:XP_019075281.1 PREDICTED: signal peptidase complex subunit 3B isoform X2 [Vitis vinifera]